MFRLKIQEKTEDEETTKRASPGELQFKKELNDLHVIPQCKLIHDPNNIMKFKAVIKPDNESYWYGGVYEFEVTVPEKYPFNAPKIYHPNIDLSGNVCLNILKEDWTATLNVSTVLAGLYFLFTDPNPNDPLNHNAAETMRDNLDTFIANVKKSLRGNRVNGEDFPRFI